MTPTSTAAQTALGERTAAGLPPLQPADIVPAARRVRLREIATSMPVGRMIGLRDIKVKYKQAALGPLWVVLAPLGLLAAVTIAFSGVTSVHTGSVPYVLFALTGLSAWTYVQLTLMVGTQAMIGNSTLVRRSTCPRIALVTATLISNVPPALIMLVISIVFSAITGHLGVRVVLLPLMLLWLLVLAWGAVLVASSISVRFRDLTAIMPLVVQAGMFVTPVGYPIDNAPPHIRILLALNPVSGVIEGFRWTLLGMSPDLKIIAISGALSLVIVVVGWIVFGRLEVRFADYV